MNLPKLEACGNFVREARTPENPAGFAVAEIHLYAQSDASGIATEIARRCNEYDELKARVAELEAELLKKHTDTELLLFAFVIIAMLVAVTIWDRMHGRKAEEEND